jgi:hypothetical protein
MEFSTIEISSNGTASLSVKTINPITQAIVKNAAFTNCTIGAGVRFFADQFSETEMYESKEYIISSISKVI